MKKIIANDDNLFKIVNNEILKYGYNCSLNHIDVSKVTIMEGLFSSEVNNFECYFEEDEYKIFNIEKWNGDISKWDTSNVKDMSFMFQNSFFNGNISKWNTSNVLLMACMFKGSKFNKSILNWKVSKVRNMCCMFSDSIFNKNISNWQISNNTDTTFMLDNSIISKKNLPKILKALY